MSQLKYLIYDIESVVNKSLLNKVLYAGEGLSDDEAYKKQVAELAEEGKTFINASFHKPVSMAAVGVAPDYSIIKIKLLGGETRTSASIVREFWDIYNTKAPVLVDFNGRGYDIRLMELWAFQLGIRINERHFKQYGTRYRFSETGQIDLQDFLSNCGAARWQGGLNLFSKLLGKPGKMTTTGDDVQGLFESGKNFEIDDYCLADAMDTYFVFLRTRVMIGELTLEKERELVTTAKKLLEEMSQSQGYFKLYLENFGEWVPEL